MNIGTRIVGYGHPTFIIAEACSNIILYLDRLDTFVSNVAKTGADALKIQLYLPEHFPPQEQESKRRTMFPRDRVAELVSLCRANNLLFGASAFDNDAVDLLVSVGADFIKLATREWYNNDLRLQCIQSGLPIFASYDWTSFPFTVSANDNMIMLACVPQYPTHEPYIPRAELGDVWGWSSHTTDYLDCLLAVSRNACVIEKHYRAGLNDYEAGWSLAHHSFAHMIEDIRRVEKMR